MASPQTIIIQNTREEILKLPTTTGIYQYICNGEIIYIGKSVSLKARLISHAENAKIDAKEAGIVNNADTIKCIVTDSEFKALLLESQLISRIKPRYNVRWKDDKSYLYIKVTIKDTYPKFYLTRKEDDKKSLYFGPFPSVRTATNVLREIRKVFPFCTQKNITKQPCFYSKIGQCNPCPNVIESLQAKQDKLRHAELDSASHTIEIRKPIRDNTNEIKKLQKEYKYNIKHVIKVLEGQTDLVLKELYKLLKLQTDNLEFEEAIQTRNRILRLEGLIHGKRLEPEIIADYNKSNESIQKLRDLLQRYYPDLQNLHRIECFDISNTSMKQGTASMVVFTDGLIDKKEYRRFKIKDESLASDFEMMNEVLQRRFKRHQWKNPNLLVVDGGKPQVRIAQQVLADLQIDVPLIGIAKRPDRLVIGDKHLQMVRPALNHPGFNLIRALRDESHRFAKKYHVYLRTKQQFS